MVKTISSPEVVPEPGTGIGSARLADRSLGFAASTDETNKVIKEWAARILPCNRYLFRQIGINQMSLINTTHGRVPRKAKGAGLEVDEVACHHSHVICANNRALSRFPEARKCGSATS